MIPFFFCLFLFLNSDLFSKKKCIQFVEMAEHAELEARLIGLEESGMCFSRKITLEYVKLL